MHPIKRRVKWQYQKINYNAYSSDTPKIFIHDNGLNKDSMEKVYEPFFQKVKSMPEFI